MIFVWNLLINYLIKSFLKRNSMIFPRISIISAIINWTISNEIRNEIESSQLTSLIDIDLQRIANKWQSFRSRNRIDQSNWSRTIPADIQTDQNQRQ